LGGHSSNKVPRLIAGVDPRSFRVGPEEAFVLACIDGTTSEELIAASTGLSLEQTSLIVARLVALGAVTLDAAGNVAPPSRSVRAASVSTTQRISVRSEEPTPRTADADFARRLHTLHDALDRASHYELLGVPENADGAAIKRAYHEFVRVFHPDRHFGEALGELKPMLERVATRLNEAYDTLSRRESRREYDDYLAAIGRTQKLDTALDLDDARAAEVANIERQIERAAREAASDPPPQTPTPASSVPPSNPRSRPSISFTAPDDAARRRALAQKLGFSSPPPARASTPAPSRVSNPPAFSSLPPTPTPAPSLAPPSPSGPEHAQHDLRQRYEQRVQRERQVQVQRFVDLSAAALAKADYAGAANALRVAHSLAPADRDIAARLAKLEERAASELWEAYVERAKYEARSGQFGRAARSYERAALGHPIARFFERAAWYYLESGGDLAHAGGLARRAVAIDPNDALSRLALARFYATSQARENALQELERAVALAPDDPSVREWIRRIKREG
jgi:curved DNA-binding protein CbpA